MAAATAQSLTPRQIAARKGAAKRSLQTAEDRRLAAWLATHTDSFDYELIAPSPFGIENYYRARNEDVEAALNGPRHQHLRKLQVDDVRRHRSREIKLRVTPTHSQQRATVAVRLDADAHRGQTDHAALVKFINERFFRPFGPSLHDEASDRGTSGFFIIEQERLEWNGEDCGPRGDGTYIRRAAHYNRLFEQVDAALKVIAQHHGFTATLELNGRLTITGREESTPVEIDEDGTVFEASTWTVLNRVEGETHGTGGTFDDTAAHPFSFKPTHRGEMPGRRKVITRGQTFRAPRCPAAADFERLEQAHFPEAVLHRIIRYAASIRGTTTPDQTLAHTIEAKSKRCFSRVRRQRKQVADEGSNPFRARFSAIAKAARETGYLGTVTSFDDLPEHAQEQVLRMARESGVSGTDREYHRDAAKLFANYDQTRHERRDKDTFAQREDFRRAEQIVTSKVSNAMLAKLRADRKIKGRIDRKTIATALVCCALNANVKAYGHTTKHNDHCSTLAVRGWMGSCGVSVNGSWVAAVMQLLVGIREISYASRGYMPGHYARRIALTGAARTLPFIGKFYRIEPKPRTADNKQRRTKTYRTTATIPVRTGDGDQFPEVMKGQSSAFRGPEAARRAYAWEEWFESFAKVKCLTFLEPSSC